MSKQELESMILAGNSRFNVDLVANFIGTNEELFKELIELTHRGDKPIAQRASWIMTVVTDKYPWMILPYLNEITDKLPKYSLIHPALARNTLRQLAQIEIPEELMGKLFDCCYNFLIDTKQPVAIRVYSMQVLFNISVKEPELQGELKLILETYLNESSAGFMSRAGKLLKKMNQQSV